MTPKGDPLPQSEWKEEAIILRSREAIREAYGAPPSPDLVIDTGERVVRSSTKTDGQMQRALDAFDADEAAIAEARRRSGIDQADAVTRAAIEAHDAAMLAVFTATPTTLAGLLAMLTLYEDREGPPAQSRDIRDQFIGVIFAAVRTMTGRQA